MEQSLVDQAAADPFEGLAEDVAQPAGVPPGRASVPQIKPAIQKVNYSHDGMINLIIAHRGISQNALAAHFGYSASWVSQVMSSDAFQARLMERAAELEDPTIKASIEDGLKGMAARSMEILKEKLANPANIVPDNLALRTLELTTRALGYGARESTVNVQVNMEAHLEKLSENLTGLLSRKKLEALEPPIEVGET
jgi:transcriptional regulator with XRE-family HTH domain